MPLLTLDRCIDSFLHNVKNLCTGLAQLQICGRDQTGLVHKFIGPNSRWGHRSRLPLVNETPQVHRPGDGNITYGRHPPVWAEMAPPAGNATSDIPSAIVRRKDLPVPALACTSGEYPNNTHRAVESRPSARAIFASAQHHQTKEATALQRFGDVFIDSPGEPELDTYTHTHTPGSPGIKEA